MALWEMMDRALQAEKVQGAQLHFGGESCGSGGIGGGGAGLSRLY